jgi:hypothetical protein
LRRFKLACAYLCLFASAASSADIGAAADRDDDAATMTVMAPVLMACRPGRVGIIRQVENRPQVSMLRAFLVLSEGLDGRDDEDHTLRNDAGA